MNKLFDEEKDDGSISYGALEKSSGGILLLMKFQKLKTQSKILRVLIDQKFRINGNHDIRLMLEY